MHSTTAKEKHHHPNYILIYGALLVLLVVSIVGPMVGNLTVLLITAFGIALVKALMVGAYFMHLNVERRYIWYLLIAAVLFLLVFFAGVAPDVMSRKGVNWEHRSVAIPAPAETPVHH